jgi:hypothetical protein
MQTQTASRSGIWRAPLLARSVLGRSISFNFALPVQKGVMCATTYPEAPPIRRSSRTSSTSSESSCRLADSPAGGHTELSETSQAVFWDSDLNSAVRCRCSQKVTGGAITLGYGCTKLTVTS